MTLQKKTLLIVCGTVGVLIASLYLASHFILLGGCVDLEDAYARREIRHIAGFLHKDLEGMDRLVRDYATWDDTYAYVAAPAENEHYIKANMVDTTFTNQGLNVILIFNPSGALVFGMAYDLKEDRAVPIAPDLLARLGPDCPLFRRRDPLSPKTGLMALREGPMLLAARPILTSNEKGPSRGTLVMGRYLDAAAEQGLHSWGGNALTIVFAPALASRSPAFREAAARLGRRNPVVIEPLDARTLAAYTVLYDIYGKPAIYLRVTMPREIYGKGQESIAYFIASLVMMAAVVGLMIALLLHRLVISRLMRLSAALKGIGTSRDLGSRVPTEGADEIASLSRAVNDMLRALERAQGELWESEVRYRNIVENTRDIIMLTRPDGTVSYMSPACRSVLGYSPDEMVNCRPSVSHPDDAPAVKKALSRALAGESGANLEYRVTTRGGAVKWVSHSWSPILSEGKLRMVVSVLRDITEGKTMEQELIKAQKLETVGVLAGGIAHDFNNILTAVWGYLSLAKSAARPMEDVVALLSEAEKASLRARDLTQQLLTFSKGGAPVKKPLVLEGVIRDAVGFAMSGSSARCAMDIPASLWLADADEGQISQVINNLVLNAVQAMPEGGVIRVSARNVAAGSVRGMPAPDRDYVAICVEDEGIGIPEEHIQRIFDPYFTTKQQGSGLGLSISYSIAKNHGGTITVGSTLGKGSAFCVYLPASHTQAADLVAERREPPRGAGRILLMDDDEVVRTVAARMLSHIGYDVAQARDGEEMLARYAEAMESGKPFAAVVMDLTIPGRMGGRDAIGKLLAMDPRARAIVSSGYSNDPVAANLARYGFRGFVPKPYRIEDLAAEVARVLSDGGGGEGSA